MPIVNRSGLPDFLSKLTQGTSKVFLIHGERYLSKEAGDLLQNKLLSLDQGTIHPIDGDTEDVSNTLARLQSFSLLPGIQIYRITDSRLFHTKNISATLWKKAKGAYQAKKTGPALRHLLSLVALTSLSRKDSLAKLSSDQWMAHFGFSQPQEDLSWTDTLLSQAKNAPTGSSQGNTTEKYIAAFKKGLPKHNYIILSAEEIDKRKKLFTYIKKNGVIIDCKIAGGASAAAQKAQRSVLLELVKTTLKDFKKTMEPQGFDILFSKVGFHPIAVVMETEKLALAVGENPTITCRNISDMVCRSREDALFELTDYFGKKQLGQTLTTLHHLLENGIHALAILATLRNYLRRLLIFRSLQLRSHPTWWPNMPAKHFQESYLPALKEVGEWTDLLAGHPYALYMSFTKAAECSCPQLKNNLQLLLEAEFRLKSSPLPHHLVLEDLFFKMHHGPPS